MSFPLVPGQYIAWIAKGGFSTVGSWQLRAVNLMMGLPTGVNAFHGYTHNHTATPMYLRPTHITVGSGGLVNR